MTGLTRWNPFRTEPWDPFRELEAFEHRLGTLFGRPPENGGGQQELFAVAEWAPLVDVTEDAKEYVIKAELPE